MKFTMILRSVIALTIACFSLHAGAGKLIEFDIDTPHGKGFSQLYVDKGKVAVVQDRMNGHIFFDQRSLTFTIVDHDQRSFILMDEAKIERAIGMASSVMGAVSGAMESVKGLPKEQREAAEAFLKSMGLAGGTAAPARPQVKNLNQQRRVAGVTCAMYRVSQGSKPTSEACVASAVDAGVAASEWQTLQAMRGLWMKYADQAAPLVERFGAGMPDVNVVRVDGLPVFINRQGKTDMMLRRTVDASVPRELITIPAGYAERNLPAM